jgi:hypothetical protein
MSTRRLAIAAAVVFSIGLLWTAAPTAQAIQRSIYASVLSKDGAPVPNLGPADFVVREDNLAREILSVEPATAPMQVALLIDNSARSSANIRDIREATSEFIKGMTSSGVRNEVAVVAVAERPTMMVDYTVDQPKLLAGAGRLFTQTASGAYLLDGLVETSQGFKKREATRPVIVAISTNGPELSNRYHDQVVGALRGVGASFHIVMVGGPPTDFISSEGRTLRQRAGRQRPRRSPEAGRERTHAPVPGHLRPAADPDSPRARHHYRQGRHAHGAWNSGQRKEGQPWRALTRLMGAGGCRCSPPPRWRRWPCWPRRRRSSRRSRPASTSSRST